MPDGHPAVEVENEWLMSPGPDVVSHGGLANALCELHTLQAGMARKGSVMIPCNYRSEIITIVLLFWWEVVAGIQVLRYVEVCLQGFFDLLKKTMFQVNF